MFNRLELLIGRENLINLKNKSVLIVGAGGVGGHVISALARCGIEHLIVIDFDIVDVSNINRQIVANTLTVGRKKVEVVTEMISIINPECKVDVHDCFLDDRNIGEIFDKYELDYVVDACDFVKTKKEIIKYCLKNKIKFVTSMGTGNKMDPSKLEIVDIRKTINDPLSRIFRKWVKDNKIKNKIVVLSSSEAPIKVGNGVGSNSFVPGSAGLLIASYVVSNMLKK